MDRLFAPPCKLLPQLEQYRFWIWMQLVMIRLYVRTVKGEQANFLYGIAPNGRVVLVRICDTQAERDAALAKQKQQDPFNWEPSKALTAALDGSSLMSAHPGEIRGPGRQDTCAQLCLPAFAGISASLKGGPLPRPDT